jgi:hypothetical protein
MPAHALKRNSVLTHYFSQSAGSERMNMSSKLLVCSPFPVFYKNKYDLLAYLIFQP